MDAAFWHERWAANQIGFHTDSVHTYLQQYWSHLPLQGQPRVLVPLCGKSLDMLWLLDQEHAVLGVEVSSIAIQAFFDENQLISQKTTLVHFQAWQCDALTLLEGDFFALTDEDIIEVQAVYDRAALIALPPDMRQRYANHLNTLLPSGTTILLITLEYPQKEMNGPPFSVLENEVLALFAPQFSVEVLERKNVLADEPRFRSKGVTQMYETAYCLVKA